MFYVSIKIKLDNILHFQRHTQINSVSREKSVTPYVDDLFQSLHRLFLFFDYSIEWISRTVGDKTPVGRTKGCLVTKAKIRAPPGKFKLFLNGLHSEILNAITSKM